MPTGAMKVIVYEGQGQPRAGADKARVVTASELAAADVVLTTYEVSSCHPLSPETAILLETSQHPPLLFTKTVIVHSHQAPNSLLICFGGDLLNVLISCATVSQHRSNFG